MSTPYWMQEKSAKNSGPQVAFPEQHYCRSIGGYLKDRTRSLKRVSLRILELVAVFIEANKNFQCNFLRNKSSKRIKKLQNVLNRFQNYSKSIQFALILVFEDKKALVFRRQKVPPTSGG
jgi:hypothetical protein